MDNYFLNQMGQLQIIFKSTVQALHVNQVTSLNEAFIYSNSILTLLAKPSLQHKYISLALNANCRHPFKYGCIGLLPLIEIFLSYLGNKI